MSKAPFLEGMARRDDQEGNRQAKSSQPHLNARDSVRNSSIDAGYRHLKLPRTEIDIYSQQIFGLLTL